MSIDVPTDKSYTLVIPVPSFRAPDAIRPDVRVFNSIGDYGMSFFSHLEQVIACSAACLNVLNFTHHQTFAESLGGLPPTYGAILVPSSSVPHLALQLRTQLPDAGLQERSQVRLHSRRKSGPPSLHVRLITSACASVLFQVPTRLRMSCFTF